MPISRCQFLTVNGFQQKFKLNCNFLQYYGLLSAILKYWKDTIKLPKSQESTIDIDGVSCKTVYNLLISSKNPAPPPPPPPTSDNRLIACGFDNNKTRLIYSSPFRVTKEINLTIFQCRVIHTILCTNNLLYTECKYGGPLGRRPGRVA